MRTLLVTREISIPPRGGAAIRKLNLFRALAQCSEVDVVMFQQNTSESAKSVAESCRRLILLPGHEVEFTERQQSMYQSSLGRLLLTVGCARPYEYLGPPQASLKKWFAEFVCENNYDVIWISRARLAVALGWRDPVRTILDGDDFDYVREYMMLRTTPWYGTKVLNYANVLKLAHWERRLPRWFARVTRCSEADRMRVPAENVVVLPNGTEISADEVCRRPENRLIFVGSLNYPPNLEGMEWFLSKVWPRVRVQIPDLCLDIVGSLSAAAARRWEVVPGVRVHGFVPELKPLWATAAISVVPLLAGAGTRLKILDSISSAVPVVSTTVGAFGLDLFDADGVYRADGPDLFAESVIRILHNPTPFQQSAMQGRETVARVYNWERIRVQIGNLTREVARAAGSIALSSNVRSICRSDVEISG